MPNYDSTQIGASKAYSGGDGLGYFTSTTDPIMKAYYNNSTLTFYYDSINTHHDGEEYYVTPMISSLSSTIPWYGHRTDITAVNFDSTFVDARPTTTEHWFSGFNNLSSIVGMKEYLNTSKVTRMDDMFYNCSLTSLDLSGFDLSSLTMADGMFMNSMLVTLDMSNCIFGENTFSISFSSMGHIEEIDLTGWESAKLSSISFNNDYVLSSIVGIESINTSNVTSMSYMFRSPRLS